MWHDCLMPVNLHAQPTRRTALRGTGLLLTAGGLTALSGCMGFMSSSAQQEVSAAMLLAAESSPYFYDAELRYLEGFSQGKYMEGGVGLSVDSPQTLEDAFMPILSEYAQIAAHFDLPADAQVRTWGYGSPGTALSLHAVDLIPAQSTSYPRISELRAHFGV